MWSFFFFPLVFSSGRCYINFKGQCFYNVIIFLLPLKDNAPYTTKGKPPFSELPCILLNSREYFITDCLLIKRCLACWISLHSLLLLCCFPPFSLYWNGIIFCNFFSSSNYLYLKEIYLQTLHIVGCIDIICLLANVVLLYLHF